MRNTGGFSFILGRQMKYQKPALSIAEQANLLIIQQTLRQAQGDAE
jgi:hypothetical protein